MLWSYFGFGVYLLQAISRLSSNRFCDFGCRGLNNNVGITSIQNALLMRWRINETLTTSTTTLWWCYRNHIAFSFVYDMNGLFRHKCLVCERCKSKAKSFEIVQWSITATDFELVKTIDSFWLSIWFSMVFRRLNLLFFQPQLKMSLLFTSVLPHFIRFYRLFFLFILYQYSDESKHKCLFTIFTQTPSKKKNFVWYWFIKFTAMHIGRVCFLKRIGWLGKNEIEYHLKKTPYLFIRSWENERYFFSVFISSTKIFIFIYFSFINCLSCMHSHTWYIFGFVFLTHSFSILLKSCWDSLYIMLSFDFDFLYNHYIQISIYFFVFVQLHCINWFNSFQWNIVNELRKWFDIVESGKKTVMTQQK